MKKTGLMTIAAVTLLLCAGCGAEEKTDNISEGMAAVSRLEYDAAIQYFDAALEANEDERQLCRGMGLAYMGLSQYEDAISYLEKALQLGSGIPDDMDYDINYYLATAYFRNGQAEDAISSYDAILALRPKEVEAYYLRGCVKLYSGDFDGAKLDFDQAISMDAQNYDRIIQIYIALVDNGYKDVGKEYFAQVIADHEKTISDYDMGRIYYYLTMRPLCISEEPMKHWEIIIMLPAFITIIR